MNHHLVCSACHQTIDPVELHGKALRCAHCGGILEVQYCVFDPERRRQALLTPMLSAKGIWHYQDFLPESRTKLTLDEGHTPLVFCKALGEKLGLGELTVKNEGANPTGSYKDRGVAVSISKAIDQGYQSVSLGSAGNAGSAAAAYSAHGGVRCILILPDGAVPERLKLAKLYGARVIRVRGSIDDCIKLSAQMQKRYGWCNVTTARPFNPYGVEGYKTIGYELCLQFQFDLPDWIVVPVGGGSLLSKIWDGLQEVYDLGLISKLPQMLGVQAKGCAPYTTHFMDGTEPVKWQSPHTIAFSIADVWPFDWMFVDRALEQSNGTACSVSDDEICMAQQELAGYHAVLAEPSSAATTAAVRVMRENGVIQKGQRVCCVISGSGLKDLDQLCEHVSLPKVLDNDLACVSAAVAEAMET